MAMYLQSGVKAAYMPGSPIAPALVLSLISLCRFTNMLIIATLEPCINETLHYMWVCTTSIWSISSHLDHNTNTQPRWPYTHRQRDRDTTLQWAAGETSRCSEGSKSYCSCTEERPREVGRSGYQCWWDGRGMNGAGQCLPNLVQSGMRQIEVVDGIRQSVVGTIR